MTSPANPTCATCRFSIHINGPQLDCLRYPKREAKHPDHWCGEHQPASTVEPAEPAKPDANTRAMEQLLRIARDYTTAPAQVRGELFRTMCELIDELDAAKGGT
jgi:hypothetical protein